MNVIAPQSRPEHELPETPLSMTALPITLPVPPGPAPLWRPGIDETPKMASEKEEEEEEEDEDEEEEDEEENTGSVPDFKTNDDGDSTGSVLRKTSPTSKKGSREQTKIQPLRLDSGLEAFRCPLCFPDCAPPANCTPIAGRKALTEHLRWHQNQEQQPEGRFACCYCAKELSSYSSLDRHLLTHTNFRPFVCNQCKRDFTTNGNLNRHVKTSHQGQRGGTTMAALAEEIPTSVTATAPAAASLPAAAVKAPKIAGPPEPSVPVTASSAVSSPKAALELSAGSPYSHGNSFGLQASSSLPTLGSTNAPFAPSCLPITSALMPSGTTPAFSSFPSPYNTAQWLAMLMRSYGNNHPMMSLPLTPPPGFLAHGPSTGLLPTTTGAELLDLPTGRPMPVLTPQNAAASVASASATAPQLMEEDGSRGRSESPASAKTPPMRPQPKRIGAKRKGVTRLRSADSKKLLYKAGLQHWGRVLRGRAIDFLKRKQKRSPEKRSLAMSTPIRSSEEEEDLSCPLDLSVKPCDADSARGDAPVTSPDLDRPFTSLSHLPALTPANGGQADDSVLDLSVRSSSISDGASPPNGGPGAGPLGLAALTENFVPPLLAAPSQHGVPIFHMRQNDSPPSIQLQALLESNNNCAKSDSLFGVLDPKKKIDEAAKIFTGRYAKRRPQKKTHLAPPTLNPFLKMAPSTPSEPITSRMDVDSPCPDGRSEASASLDSSANTSMAVNRKKNSYKDAPNRMLCPIEGCEQQFPWKSSLKRHVITHYDFKPYKCVTCGRHFSTKSNRERHIERLHGHRNKRPGRVQRSVVESSAEPEDTEVPGGPALASEDIESMNFSDMKADRMSEEILEKAGTIVTAPNPERLNGTFASARLGRQSSASETGSATPAPTFARNGREASPKSSMCCQCRTEVSGGAQGMQLHLLTAHPSTLPAAPPASEGAVFKCPVCAREFPRQEPALEHMRTVHPSEWALTASKLNVDSLIQGAANAANGWPDGPCSSGGEEEAAKRVLCPVCRRKFASFQDLQRHARSHTGERPFACSFCGREFALKHSLNRHMRTHVTCASGEEL